jgi:hypothetical protein
MAENLTIVGELDGQPMSTEQKAKVQNALKGALEREILIPTVVGTHHISVTHLSIVVARE